MGLVNVLVIYLLLLKSILYLSHAKQNIFLLLPGLIASVWVEPVEGYGGRREG
jgi:hypothetical protein